MLGDSSKAQKELGWNPTQTPFDELVRHMVENDIKLSRKTLQGLLENKMHKNARIYIAGHGGLAGSAIIRKLTELGYTNLLFRTPSELNLINQQGY